MHRSTPKIRIVSKTIPPLSFGVHFLPGTQIPDILTAVLGSAANKSIAWRHPSRPASDLSDGSPVWFKMIVVSGKSQAKSTASPKCHQGVCKS